MFGPKRGFAQFGLGGLQRRCALFKHSLFTAGHSTLEGLHPGIH